MLLIPTPKEKLPKGMIPYGLALLLIIQAVIFFTVQLDDAKYQDKAINFYFQSELNKIEFPLYVRFLRRYLANDLNNERLQKMTDANTSEYEIYWLQRYDPFFQAYLLTDQSVPESSLYYIKWQEKRREYLQLLSKDATAKYGFKTAAPDQASSLLSLFLHGNNYQFIVNFIFILMIGFLIEGLVGFIGMMASYFLCSFIMLSTYCLFAPNSLIPLLGASGGVAGLIGMLTVLYGTQKARLYYIYFPHFKYTEISCIAFLILWLMLQFVLIATKSLNLINFIPQCFALIGGAILGVIVKRMLSATSLAPQLHEDKLDDFQIRLNKAGAEISNLNYVDAMKILKELIDEYPTNKEVHLEIFNIVKLKPASEEYHHIVQKIFCLKDMSRSTDAMINLVFNNYVRRAKPTIRFDIETFFSLLQRFRKAGYYEDSIKILNVLVKQNPDGRMSEALARELLLLARAYLMKNDKVQANRLLELLTELFPHTESAKQVKRIPVAK